jgi:hypothetical protein
MFFFNVEIFEMSWCKFRSLVNSKWNVGGHRVVGNLMHTVLKWGVHYKWHASETKVEGTWSMLESILLVGARDLRTLWHMTSLSLLLTILRTLYITKQHNSKCLFLKKGVICKSTSSRTDIASIPLIGTDNS